MRCRCSGGMPGPRSATRRSAHGPSRRAATSTSLPGGAKLAALSSRFSSTCNRRWGARRTNGREAPVRCQEPEGRELRPAQAQALHAALGHFGRVQPLPGLLLQASVDPGDLPHPGQQRFQAGHLLLDHAQEAGALPGPAAPGSAPRRRGWRPGGSSARGTGRRRRTRRRPAAPPGGG